MIPQQQNFEEVKRIEICRSNTQMTVQQSFQNLEQENNFPEHPNPNFDQQNLYNFNVKESSTIRQFAPVLKKQQSDTSSDYKKHQIIQTQKSSSRNMEINLQRIKLNPIEEQQQISKVNLENQFKSKNEEHHLIIKCDDTNEDLNEIIFQIQEKDNDPEINSQNIQILSLTQKKSLKEQDQQNACSICGSNNAVKIQLLECEHKFCKNCYKDYLEDKIKNAKINNIYCLQEGCITKFPESVIKETVSETKFAQYLFFKYKLEIENDMNKKWCPAKGCDLFVERNPKQNIVICKCGASVCFNCGQIAHQGLLCEQAIEDDFRNAINKYSIKYCPGCKAHVQKNAGCNHMTCIQCHFQYCWVCLQPYYEYHYRYWSLKGCAIWSNGRFKTNKVVNHPDAMRWIFFLPRLILFLLRGPLLILKFLFIVVGKSFIKPFQKLNKKVFKKLFTKCGSKFWLIRILIFFLAIFLELFILITVLLIFPFYLLFYRIFKEFKWLCIKGCAY
ncbi:unnamed protein product [Paramecium sonneborni]|uniref:RBR-type E3 ubiquitin transferase n=1 Tax=Paramecium sonneborni TaxID=65129 RepID=A0A8S1R5D7_9CILI|nr:unnamed protein product [Paramecium sonneborni]